MAADQPATPDDRLLDFRPGSGMRWEITRSTADTEGALLEATNWLDPGMAAPPIHVHPGATESYEVVEGVIEVHLDGRWRTAGAGATVTVPPGMPHSLRNRGTEVARIVNVHAPALRIESFFRDLHRLIADGAIRRLPPTDPGSAVRAAMVFTRYPEEIRAVRPPHAAFAALAAAGRMLGLRA